MLTAVVVLLVLLVALSFYKFVERKHKVIVAKVLGGIGIIAIVVFAAIWWRDRQNRAKAQKEAFAEFLRTNLTLKVSFLPDSTVRDALSIKYGTDNAERIAFRVCNEGRDTVDSFTIHATTWKKGHSKKESVIAERQSIYEKIQTLSSDVVLPPQECSVPLFHGSWIIRDSVTADAVAVFRSRLIRP